MFDDAEEGSDVRVERGAIIEEACCSCCEMSDLDVKHDPACACELKDSFAWLKSVCKSTDFEIVQDCAVMMDDAFRLAGSSARIAYHEWIVERNALIGQLIGRRGSAKEYVYRGELRDRVCNRDEEDLSEL